MPDTPSDDAAPHLPCDGLVLFAHGARDPAWARPFQTVAALLAQSHPALPLRLAYLELMSPDLATAGAELAALGCRQVRIVPVFLGAGGHVRRDLPAQVQALADAHPQVRWDVAPAIGESPAVLRAIADVAVAPAAEAAR